MKKILLINPPIYDFVAYDLWAKPLGLLYLSGILKEQGVEVGLLDYMDRYFGGSTATTDPLLATSQQQHTPNPLASQVPSPQGGRIERNPDSESHPSRYGGSIKGSKILSGTGHYLKRFVEKPLVFGDIPRRYARFGILQEQAEEFLHNSSKPDLILVTSVMTYWYLGVFEAISSVKKVFPDVPIALGGVYATLCSEHAKATNVDFIVKGDLSNLNSVFKELNMDISVPVDFANYPPPDISHYKINEYAAIKMSFGCPFRCSYCAQDILCDGRYISKPPETVFNEIKSFADKGIKNIAFYDDALLYKPEEQIKPLLRKIVDADLNICIHTPNGLHIKYLDLELAQLMKKSGFIMPRFSLETSNQQLQIKTGNKTSNSDFEKAIGFLNKAGFKRGEYTIYLLMGIPGQSLDDVADTIIYVNKHGGKVSLSEYSIIPQTKDFKDIDEKFIKEPLYHNKSVYPLYDLKDWNKINEVKNLAKRLNALL